MKNIYTILEEIGFEEKSERIGKLAKLGVDPKQLMFSIVQEFYENILEDGQEVFTKEDLYKAFLGGDPGHYRSDSESDKSDFEGWFENGFKK
jgi:hypothetical protein